MTTLTDRELHALMWQASNRAAEAAVLAGHSRASKVVKDSAYAAALAVYQRERPEEAPGFARPAPAVVLPAEPPADPVKERMDL